MFGSHRGREVKEGKGWAPGFWGKSSTFILLETHWLGCGLSYLKHHHSSGHTRVTNPQAWTKRRDDLVLLPKSLTPCPLLALYPAFWIPLFWFQWKEVNLHLCRYPKTLNVCPRNTDLAVHFFGCTWRVYVQATVGISQDPCKQHWVWNVVMWQECGRGKAGTLL